MSVQNPVILVPGITASRLSDWYPVSPETVWSVLGKKYTRVALHPDNLKYERDEPARVVPDKVFTIPYGELIDELRHDLSPRGDRPTPVYPFAYDWRHPLDETEALLADFVKEVIERTMLIPHYHEAGYADDPKVDLVGHSMGGLIIAGYLEKEGRSAPVGKVATLGSPFRGSFEAALKVTTGLAELGLGSQSSSEREAARLTPALYHLLPKFRGAIDAEPGLPRTLYNPNLWQPGILDTIAEYIRLHGLEKSDRKIRAHRLFRGILRKAQAHRRRLESFKLGGTALQDNDWLCIVGVNTETRIKLRIRNVRNKPVFDLTSTDRQNRWDKNEYPQAERVRTGDGTVPYLGAQSAFIPVEKLVCVTPQDFGYWEVADRLLNKTVGLHGMLPKMNLIHRLIYRHFTGKSRKGTWGRPAPDLPEGQAWDPPIKRLNDESKRD